LKSKTGKPEDPVKRIVIAVMLSSVAWAQAKFQPLNVKTGLWESTITSTTSGQMPIPAEMLAKLSPEQRAKFEARMKQNSTPKTRTYTNRDCETKEKLAEQPFNSAKECKQTITASTSTKAEVKMICEFGDVKTSGIMRIDVLSPENVKGSGQMTSNGGGHSMTVDTSFSAKWLGPSCGDVK
jgi:hypothetical protein